MKPIIERFTNQIELIENGCWKWTGNLSSNGYGHIRIRGINVLSHRFAYEYFIGKIPSGMQIDHLCKNRACVNPNHLEAVTPIENIKRSNVGKFNSSKTHCKYGHEYNESNTIVGKNGNRHCRICDRKRKSTETYKAYQREYQLKYRAINRVNYAE